MADSPTTSESSGRHNEYAVVDLGSNSFHLHVIRMIDGESHSIDRYRDVVKLADGLRPNGTIKPEKQLEALQVLRRYGDRIHGFLPGNVRAAGTSAFRHARKASTFVRDAEAALGYPIDIISGEEEARLIYLGIISEDAPRERKRFIIDIGGGSTEFIYGEDRKPVCISSVEVGNISLTRNVFEGKELTDSLFEATVKDVVEVLRATDVYEYRHSFQVVLGASGTLRMIAAILTNLGLGGPGIERDALANLAKKFISKGKRKPILQAGLPEERIATFPGALALLSGIMDAFTLTRIDITRAGVRAGLLHDMLLLPRGEDRRRITLTRWMERHRVDREQRDRVLGFIRRHLPDILPHLPKSFPDPLPLLSWAADLHEIGLSINYSGYHKHGAYLVKNSDLPGFTRVEQGQLAFLVLNHRKNIKLDRLDPDDVVPLPLLFLFRLAWLLHRKRATIDDPVVGLRIEEELPQGKKKHGKNGKKKKTESSTSRPVFVIQLQPAWLQIHPLAARQFFREQERWAEVGVTLRVE